MANKLDVSAPQALAAINQFVEAGILGERTGYRRNRVFEAEAVLAIVNRSFGSASPDWRKRAKASAAGREGCLRSNFWSRLNILRNFREILSD
ncbi:hypothetical protein [Sphingopyxis indica]|uniref:hypothetical protein n=1 Tax=Sphingopyxis indica TaxID=436663 RepID=UPI001BB06FD4|nr:hypothetical protein [Sphingopyxis indica]